jgi:quercetin dioxygenase-like cupin family protein
MEVKMWMRIFTVLALALSLGPVAQADQLDAVPEKKTAVTPVLKSSVTIAGDPIVLPQNDAQVIVSIVEIEAGATLPIHKHIFPRYGYVLQGTLQVTNLERQHTDEFQAGDFILESVGHWHRGTNAGDVPVKLLVIDIVEKGAENSVLKRD